MTVSMCEKHRIYFTSREEFDRHVQEKHLGLVCEDCKRIFPNAVAMRLHKNHVHKNDSTNLQ